MRVKEIRKIVLFIGIGMIKKGRGISQGGQIQISQIQKNNLEFENLIIVPQKTGSSIFLTKGLLL